MQVFPLVDASGNLYSPSRQAATLAKYSRSPESALDLVNKTPELSSEKFQERVIVGYGHNSVAELSTIPVCFEGVSVIASKVLESLPRPGCSEKSTRMQRFHRDQVCLPLPELEAQFSSIVDDLFALYNEIVDWAIETNPTGASKGIEKKAFDIARSVLPAGIKTNLCLVAYPRDIAKLQSFLISSENTELVEIGSLMKQNLLKIGGPLIRHADGEPWLQNWKVRQRVHYLQDNKPGVALVGCSTRVWHEYSTLQGAAAYDGYSDAVGKDLLYQPDLQALFGTKFTQHCYEFYGLRDFSEFKELMDNRPYKCEVPDIFKKVRVVYDVFMDYGSFRDLQRHRRMNQVVDMLTPNHGWVVPEELSLELFQKFQTLMEKVQEKCLKSGLPAWAIQYVLPMAFIHYSNFDMDLQQLYYLTELRTQPEGHTSYKRIAWGMAEQATRVFPLLMQWCRAIDPYIATDQEEK